MVTLALFLHEFSSRHQILAVSGSQSHCDVWSLPAITPAPLGPSESLSLEKTACPRGRGTFLRQSSSSLALLHRGPLCTAERPWGALCESFPVILPGEVLPFFKARFDIFTGLTSGAFFGQEKKAGILSFIFTKPLIGFFIKLDSIISSIGVGAQLYLVQNISLHGFFLITKCLRQKDWLGRFLLFLLLKASSTDSVVHSLLTYALQVCPILFWVERRGEGDMGRSHPQSSACSCCFWLQVPIQLQRRSA